MYVQRHWQGRRGLGNAWSKRHVRAAGIVMRHPGVQQASQVVFCERDHEIQALPPQRADESFAEGIGLRTLGWGFEHREPQMADAVVELGREDAIAVMHEEAIAMVHWDRLTQLLERPVGRGMGRHIAVEHTARGMLHHDKHVEQAKGRRDHHAEVTGDDRRGHDCGQTSASVGTVTRVPSPRVYTLGHVFPDSPWRDPQAQLQQEFIGNTLLTPRGVVMRHLADERLQVRRNAGPSRAGFPAPEQAESLAMPAGNVAGVTIVRLAPVEPAAEPDEGKARGIGGAPRRDVSFLIQRELFAQKEVFCGERRGRAQAEPEEACRIHQERQQRARQLHKVMERAQDSQHTQGTLLRQGNPSWLLSLPGAWLSSGARPCTPGGQSASSLACDAAMRLLRTTPTHSGEMRALAYVIIRALRQAWRHLDLTVEEGVAQLATLCALAVRVPGQEPCCRVPKPRGTSQRFLEAVGVQLPDVLPQRKG